MEDREKDRRAEGQADMTNLIDSCHNFAKGPKRGREREREGETAVSLNYF
jgi:hypothetical protein